MKSKEYKAGEQMMAFFQKRKLFSMISVAALMLPAALTHGATAADKLADNWTMLETYCMECHNFEDYAGGVDFSFFTAEDVGSEAEIFEMALKKLRGGVMPPPSQEQPSVKDRWDFIASLENALDAHAEAHPEPGRVALRRLNRTEYVNAIYEMTGVELDAGLALPKDDNSDGFDNIAGVLKISPAFLDQYISAGRSVAEQAVGDSKPRNETVFLPSDTSNQSNHIHGLPLGTRGGALVEYVFPADGEYSFSIPGMAGAGYVLGMEYEHTAFLTIDGERIFQDSIGGGEDFKRLDQEQAPAVADINSRFADIKVPMTAGLHKIGFGFIARSFAEGDEFLHNLSGNRGMGRIAQIRGIQVAGPLNSNGVISTPSRSKVMICTPADLSQEQECARQIFANLARKAFRRPITDVDLESAMKSFANGREELGSFDEGVKYGMLAIFASPKFLFRDESIPDGAVAGEIVEISDLELASRLSFFLWSSTPDAELLELAVNGDLRKKRVLSAQVERMLDDPRSEALVKNFVFQWLRLRDLDGIGPDAEIYPQFNRALLENFKQEISLFSNEIIQKDSSVLDFVRADYTYLNEGLALHYDITDVKGDNFRRVVLGKEERFGLLGKGGVQMVTSYANRTTPVIRGAYILENFQGVPPAAPPPNVEAFPETEEGAAVSQTVRERLEQHRDNPACAGCHDVMDPLGLALENFNAIGKWRDRDSDAGNALIDSSGQLADGTPLKGINDLRAALVKRPDQFVQMFTEKLLTYSLGRGVEPHDMPAVRSIVDDAERDDYSFSSIVMGIVNSNQFQKMTVPDEGLQVGSL